MGSFCTVLLLSILPAAGNFAGGMSLNLGGISIIALPSACFAQAELDRRSRT